MRTDFFSDPAAVASYVERTRRVVPGLDVVHHIVEMILADSVPDDGHVLVVGAGGGLEISHLAERHEGWTFDGVDPSAPMLHLARASTSALAARVALHEGYVTDAPDGPFDAATCLLTLHFLPKVERLCTLREIHRRLSPGAPLVTFHHSVPDGNAREVWLERYARYAAGPDGDPAQIATSVTALSTQLPILAPEEDEALLLEAGFREVELFYTAITLRGWLAYRSVDPGLGVGGCRPAREKEQVPVQALTALAQPGSAVGGDRRVGGCRRRHVDETRREVS